MQNNRCGYVTPAQAASYNTVTTRAAVACGLWDHFDSLLCVQRETLELDAECDAFISAVAKVSKKVVVLVQSPGAFLTPWRAEVSTIATMFLGGQETGGAWADIIFGDVIPQAKLPLSFPKVENEQKMTTSQWPA